jgi:hypothetical protein
MKKSIKDFIARIRTPWSFMRILRFVLSLLLVIQSVVMKEWIFLPLGAFFMVQSLAGWGCCSPAGCEIQPPASHQKIQD